MHAMVRTDTLPAEFGLCIIIGLSVRLAFEFPPSFEKTIVMSAFMEPVLVCNYYSLSVLGRLLSDPPHRPVNINAFRGILRRINKFTEDLVHRSPHISPRDWLLHWVVCSVK